MICPCSVSRFRLLRRLCALLCAFFGCCAIAPARPQDLDKPLQTIDEEITAFAFAPDGRIVYAVRRPYKTKKYDLEHDDIWIQDAGGKRRRILQGDKFTRGERPFTYAVDSFRWSPNGRIILAQFFTTTLLDDSRAGSVAGFCHRPGCSIRRGRRQPVDASQNCNQLPPALPHKADRFMR